MASSRAEAPRLSVVRHVLLWWFAPPYSPWVAANVAIDFTAAQAYLAMLAEQPGARVSVQHLLTAAVGRTLAAFPEANARIIGGRVVPQDAVGVAAPVNLLGHAAGTKRELSVALTAQAERRTLRDIAQASRDTVRQEREDRITNPFIRGVVRALENAPAPVVRRSMDALDRAMQHPAIAARVYGIAPLTTVLPNPGAAISGQPGMLFRGAAVMLPGRLVHVGTLWGITPVQDEVIPVAGVPAVRPMLPIMLLFDHRLIDGVRASRMLAHLNTILQDPAAVFGAQGEQAGPPPQGRDAAR